MPTYINNILTILEQYKRSFSSKTYNTENLDTDILMNLYGITPELKHENRQYWGRELGMVWELVTKELFRQHPEFREAPSNEFGTDKPVDYFLGNFAIDAKYRIGSGDSGTLKKFKQYGTRLQEEGYTPIFLILREDNLPAAITAALSGGWTIYTHNDTFAFIQQHLNINIVELLLGYQHHYIITR